MAFCAFHIPILVSLSPVQLIGVHHLFLRVKMKPMLPALSFRAAVPGNTQRLITTSGKCNQILLQWFNTECISDRVIGQFSVRSVGTHHILAVALEESRFDSVVFEFSIIEIAKYGLCISLLHRQIMIRT